MDGGEIFEKCVTELLIERGTDVFIARGESQRLDARERKLALETQRALDFHFPVAERSIRENLRLRRFLELQEGVADALNVVGAELAILLAHILPQRAEPLGGIDELDLTFAVIR